MPELTDTYELLLATLRQLGAEVTSPWFYLQSGLILAGAGIAFAIGAAVRARTDMTALAMGWPAPLRLLMRILVGSASTVAFAVLMLVARIVMSQMTWPSRSYLLAVSAKLAVAWLVIRLVTSVIRTSSSSGWWRSRPGWSLPSASSASCRRPSICWIPSASSSAGSG